MVRKSALARGLAARALPPPAARQQHRAFSDESQRDVEIAKTEKQMVAILRRIADAV
jgi:hypothetical protein